MRCPFSSLKTSRVELNQVVCMITYNTDQKITVDQFIQILKKSTLGERRPVDDVQRLQTMLNHADILVTAWDGKKLIGISRAISDFAFCTYVSDLAVDEAYQKKGIGKRLLAETRKKSGGRGTFLLLAAPKAHNYYPHIGFKLSDRCFFLSEETKLL